MRLLFILPILLLTACNSAKPDKRVTLPHTAKIVSKLRITREYMHRGTDRPGEIPFFKELRFGSDFWLDGALLHLDRQQVFDNNGRLKEVWAYLAEGPDISTDSSTLRREGGDTMLVRFSADREYVIDCGDTLAITHIFENEQLLFTERSTRADKGRRWIYHYR